MVYDKHYIPSRLDASEKFLFWDKDVLAIALAGLLLGIFAEQNLMGAAIGTFTAVLYSRLKTGQHAGMAHHLLYWHAGGPPLRGLPPSAQRQLVG